jgi:transcriptional regulator with XRE-family HTH domain
MDEKEEGMDDKKVTAARLKAARQRRGWSREELAIRSGLSWSAITQIESGRRTNLRPATVVALATALGVTADYLLGSELPTASLLEHELLLFADDDAFVRSAASCVTTGVTLGEPTLVVTSPRKAEVLREHLGPDSGKVTFEEADGWYASPAEALAGYRRFATEALGTGAAWVRVVGEPVWAGKTDAELESLVRYESLLNLAFVALPITVVCLYDAGVLDAQIVAHARATHPHAREGDTLRPSGAYEDPGEFLLD